jgi:hypothetical protein
VSPRHRKRSTQTFHNPSSIDRLSDPGIGWNFLNIGGTTLLTTTKSRAEKRRAHATGDMIIFAAASRAATQASHRERGRHRRVRWPMDRALVRQKAVSDHEESLFFVYCVKPIELFEEHVDSADR